MIALISCLELVHRVIVHDGNYLISLPQTMVEKSLCLLIPFQDNIIQNANSVHSVLFKIQNLLKP